MWVKSQLCFWPSRHCWSCEFCCVIPSKAVVGAASRTEAVCWWDLLSGCWNKAAAFCDQQGSPVGIWTASKKVDIWCDCFHVKYNWEKNWKISSDNTTTVSKKAFDKGSEKLACLIQVIIVFYPCWIFWKGLETFTYWITRQQRETHCHCWKLTECSKRLNTVCAQKVLTIVWKNLL